VRICVYLVIWQRGEIASWCITYIYKDTYILCYNGAVSIAVMVAGSTNTNFCASR